MNCIPLYIKVLSDADFLCSDTGADTKGMQSYYQGNVDRYKLQYLFSSISYVCTYFNNHSMLTSLRKLTVVFVLLLLFIGNNVYCQPITLISWNLKDLGQSKDDTEFKFIANTIRNADIIAIQEVVAISGGAQAVARLADELNRMGAAWDYKISDPTLSSSYKRERYAFLWKKHRIKLVGEPWLQKGEYATLIEREPYFGTFSALGKTFTIVSFHAITSSKQPETEIKYFKFLPVQYPNLKLIFVGDFNLPESHTVFNPLKSAGYKSALKNQKTTLKQQCVDGVCLKSEYDNIFYQSSHIKLISSGIIPFYKNLPSMEDANKISDHVPVVLKFEIL